MSQEFWWGVVVAVVSPIILVPVIWKMTKWLDARSHRSAAQKEAEDERFRKVVLAASTDLRYLQVLLAEIQARIHMAYLGVIVASVAFFSAVVGSLFEDLTGDLSRQGQVLLVVTYTILIVALNLTRSRVKEMRQLATQVRAARESAHAGIEA